MKGDEISVLLPTFRRPDALAACLEALAHQTRPPSSVIVVVRREDDESEAVARAYIGRLPVSTATIDRPGQVQALNRGLSLLGTPLVAITDDDARPRPDWLERISAHFEDASVGAVGGRDVVHWAGQILGGSTNLVGRVRWYGRVIGNHHLSGRLQDVEFLKGANMSYRRHALLGFDERLMGTGPQVCNDMQASLRVRVSGWRVVWDPEVAVDHFPATRAENEERVNPTAGAFVNELHNQTYILLSLLPGWRRVTSFLFSVFVGSIRAPGLFALPVAVLRLSTAESAWNAFRSNMSGRARGLATFVRTRGQPLIPAEVAIMCQRGPGP